MSSSSSDLSVTSKWYPSKVSTDRHRKIDGRDRRILLSPACTRLLSEVSIRLGHRTMGETVQWLLVQAKASIDAVLQRPSVYRNPSPIVTFPSPINNTCGFEYLPAESAAQVIPYNPMVAVNSPLAISQLPISPLPISPLAVSRDNRFSESDTNISTEMIEKFFSEFSL